MLQLSFRQREENENITDFTSVDYPFLKPGKAANHIPGDGKCFLIRRQGSGGLKILAGD